MKIEGTSTDQNVSVILAVTIGALTIWCRVLYIYDKADLKKSWFAVLLPSHPKQALPKIFIALSENLFLMFSLNTVNKYFLKIIKSCILIQVGYRNYYLCILTLYKEFVNL